MLKGSHLWLNCESDVCTICYAVSSKNALPIFIFNFKLFHTNTMLRCHDLGIYFDSNNSDRRSEMFLWYKCGYSENAM